MKFNGFGQRTGDNILIISPLNINEELKTIFEKSFPDFYFVYPDLINRDEKFISFERDCDLIYKYLRDKGILEFSYAISFSYGANILMDLLSRNAIKVKKAILDGYINVKISLILREILKRKFASYSKKIISDQNTINRINDLYPSMYENIRQVTEEIDRESLENFLSAANGSKTQKMQAEKILFIYGDLDPSFKNVKKLKKKYLEADFISLPETKHSTGIFKDPQAYLKILKV